MIGPMPLARRQDSGLASQGIAAVRHIEPVNDRIGTMKALAVETQSAGGRPRTRETQAAARIAYFCAA